MEEYRNGHYVRKLTEVMPNLTPSTFVEYMLYFNPRMEFKEAAFHHGVHKVVQGTSLHEMLCAPQNGDEPGLQSALENLESWHLIHTTSDFKATVLSNGYHAFVRKSFEEESEEVQNLVRRVARKVWKGASEYSP